MCSNLVLTVSFVYINGTKLSVDAQSGDIHYSDIIMGAIASQFTSPTTVYSTVYSGGDQRKYQSSTPLAFVWGIHRWPVNSPHKRPVTRKMFPFDDVTMQRACHTGCNGMVRLKIIANYYISRIRRIGGCYGFASKPPAARHPPPAMVLTR